MQTVCTLCMLYTVNVEHFYLVPFHMAGDFKLMPNITCNNNNINVHAVLLKTKPRWVKAISYGFYPSWFISKQYCMHIHISIIFTLCPIEGASLCH